MVVLTSSKLELRVRFRQNRAGRISRKTGIGIRCNDPVEQGAWPLRPAGAAADIAAAAKAAIRAETFFSYK